MNHLFLASLIYLVSGADLPEEIAKRKKEEYTVRYWSSFKPFRLTSKQQVGRPTDQDPPTFIFFFSATKWRYKCIWIEKI